MRPGNIFVFQRLIDEGYQAQGMVFGEDACKIIRTDLVPTIGWTGKTGRQKQYAHQASIPARAFIRTSI